MEKSFLLQALLIFSLAAAGPLRAGEAPAVTLSPRQMEIMRHLLAFRPAGMAGDGEWMLDVWDSDGGWERFARTPAREGNAAALFRRLEDLYPSEKKELEREGGEAGGVQLLLEAGEVGECRLSPDVYPEFDRVTAKQPDFLVLRTYLQALLNRALREERAGRPAEAERCYLAAVACGRHLTNDKSSAVVYMTGLIFKLRGGQGYEGFLRRRGMGEEADAVRGFLTTIGEVLRAFNWKANEALGSMEDFASLPAAIRVAARDKEACWRKEAILRLALFRHGAVAPGAKIIRRNPAFEQAAEAALVRAASGDPDPAVRRFAVWAALNVKPDMYETLEHRFTDALPAPNSAPASGGG